MTDQRNIVHKIMCGCDANQACPEWDRCLDAELAVRETINHEHLVIAEQVEAAIHAHTESWPA